MSAGLLRVHDLAIEFAGRSGPLRVVDGVSFALDRREILGMVGESGSGKTLTCRALMRLLPPRFCRIAAGEILLDGQDVVRMGEAELGGLRGERVAMIFQNPTAHLDPVMRIGDQIAEGLIRHQGLGRRAARARAIELLDEVGIRDAGRQVDAYPHQFSGGMRQRAMIAAALACEPELLIADEPTTALDVTIQAQILDLLHGLRERHDLAIVLVSHDLALVGDFCDRVVVMERGRIVEAGPTASVVGRPRHPYTVRLVGAQPQLATPGRYFPIDGAPSDGPPAGVLGPAVLRVEGLEVTFPRPRGPLDWLRRRPATGVRALDGVSLTLARGEALGIVGESGSGKSTLARAVVRLVEPTRGDILLDGRSLRERSPENLRAWRRRVQLIFQDPLGSLNPRHTAAEAVAEPLRVHGLCPRSEIHARVRGLMAEVGLEESLAARRPHQLSGGQCQRVGIARALAMSPDVLVADEPTSALDVTIQAQILNLLMRLRAARQLSLIFISHDLAVVRHLCARVLVMERGRIVEAGTTEDVFARPRHPYTQSLLRAVPTFTLDARPSVAEHGTRVAASATQRAQPAPADGRRQRGRNGDMSTRSVVATALGLAVLATGSAWAEGVLKIGRDQDSVFMDPILVSQNADVWVLNNINALLVRNTRDATGIEPDLAESWTISEDGRTYTFTLREGLLFSDGTAVRSSDAKFSIERLRDGEGSVFGSMFTVIDTIETPDERTIVFHLKERSTPFLSILALFAAAVLPEAAITADYDAFAEQPIGAGAFRLVEWRRGDKIVLERNEHYWEEGLPKLDGVEWQYIPNDNTRILQLQAGEIDAMIFVPFNRIAELEQTEGIQVHLDPSSRMDHILINHSHPPLDDVRVRRALAQAIDVDAIIEAVTFGYGTPANSYIPAGGMYYNPDNPRWDYDVEAAKALLAEAGVEDLTLDFVVQAGDANYEQVAVLVQDQLKAIGVDVNIVKQEVGQTWDTIVAGEYDLSTNYWTNDVIDPDQKTGFALYGADPDVLSYYTRYDNPEVNTLIEQARVEADADKRRDMYYDIQRIAQDDVNWIGLYYSPFRNAARDYVDEFFQNPMGRFMLETTTVSR